MKNLLKLLSMSSEELNYFVGTIVGTADAYPERAVSEVVDEALAEIEKLRDGAVDPFAGLIEDLFGRDTDV